MNSAAFHARVQECFDARIDPLDDDRVCAFLDAHPEHLPAFAELRACLAAVPSLDEPVMPRPRRRLPWLLFVTSAAAVLAVVSTRSDAPPRPPSRILATSMRELRPRANAAASFEVRQVIASPSTRLEIFERRTEPR